MIRCRRFVNLTPHDVVIYDEEGNVIKVIPKSGRVARVSQREELVGHIEGIPIVRTVYGETLDLPPPEEGTCYIVSLVVKQANPHRKDLLVPNTGPTRYGAVRDEKGRIIGVRSLQI